MPTNSSLTKLSRKSSTEEIIVGEHLAELRGRIRLLTWISGLCWMSVAFLGGMLVTGTLDWLLHFDDSGTRLVIGLALLSLSGWMLWRQLIAPLRLPLSGPFLAGRVERRFPGLKNRLLSAVEFLDHRLDAKLGSTELQKAVVGQALRDLERIEPSDVVETKAIRNVTIAGVLVFLLTALVVLIRPLEAATSVQRMIFPFANIPWPRAVELKLVGTDLSPVNYVPDQPILMARGDTLELYVENERGKLPERVWFEYQNEEDGPIVRDSLRQTTVRDENGRAREMAVISWIATRGSMRFRASGGDDEVMPFYRVDVVPPPGIETLQVTVTPPTYSQQPVQVLPPGVGHVQGLLGTKVEVRATADKRLKLARLRVGEQPPVPLELQDNEQSFAAVFEIKAAVVSNYWFELTDTEGFTDREAVRYELRGIADSVPDVAIEIPVSDVLITADAELPVEILAKDDLGLRDVRIAYQVGDDEKLKVIPLFSATGPSATGSSPNGETASTNGEPGMGPQRHQASYVWKMADLSPEPGMKIVFRGEATDDYDLGQPHVGKSVPRSITIVSGDEKQKELAMRVSDLLDDLKQATQLQQRALQQTQELQTQLDNVGELRPQDIDQLQRTELDQRQAASRLTHAADGVETQARQILDEFQANRLKDETTEQRLERVVGELGNLGREALPEAERALMQAQKLAEQGVRPEKQGRSSPPRSGDDSRQAAPEKKSAGRQATGARATGSEEVKDDSKKTEGKSKPDDASQAEPSTPNNEESSTKGKEDAAAAIENQNPADADPPTQSPAQEDPASANSPPGENSKDDGKGTTPEDSSATRGGDPQSEGATSPEPTKKAPSPPQKSLRSALAEAQVQQSRSLESLSELQESLTEWRDRRDVSKDLGSVVADQEKLQQDAAELAAQTMSKSAAELSQQEKAELNKLADRQRKVAEQLEQFRKQLDKTSDSLQKNDPDTAERLNEVGQELRQQETASKLQEAANNIAENRMGAAADSQQQAMDELREVERMMKRQPNENTEQFLQQTEEALREFQEIRSEQQNLAERFEELNQQEESIQKEEQQEELMRQQEELTERMAKAERKLERLQLRGASDSANRARKRLNEMMKQAQDVDTEESGEEMQQAMEEALEDLDQVEMELTLEKRVAKERLAFEQLEKIEDQLKSLRSRQEAVIAETIRLEEAKNSEGRMTRGQVKTLLELSETERSLQGAAEEMAQNMASAEVFSLVLKRLGRSLKFAADALSARQTDGKTQAMEQDAIRKIDSLLSVLKQEQKKRDPAEPPAEKPEELAQERQQEEEKPEQAQPPGEMLPELAQLKLLKSLQEEYLERTELLNQFRDKDGTLPAAMEEEKSELAREQAELADFARNLIAKFLQQKPEQTADETREKEAEERRKDEDATKIDP